MSTFTGVKLGEIGSRYDVAIGFDNGSGTANMVGYVLAPTTVWQESTNLTDNDRLVQIGSDNTTDRFTYFPKVSQGDWSGGERQINFVDPTRYFSSTRMETSIPGALQILGTEITVNLPALVGTTPIKGSRAIENDGQTTYVRTTGGASGNFVTLFNAGGAMTARTAAGNIVLSELIRTPRAIVASSVSNGIWQLNDNTQVTTDVTTLVPGANPPVMAYNAGKYFYAFTISPWNLRYVTGAPPFAVSVQVLAHNASEDYPYGMVGGSTGVVYGSIGIPASGTAPTYFNNETYLWQSDGTSTETYLGVIPGLIRDMVNVQGTIYILSLYAGLGVSGSVFPILTTLTNDGVLAMFDDYRVLDSSFQPIMVGTGLYGNLSSDGRFLYMAFGGFAIKRYDLTKTAVGNAVVDVTPTAINAFAAAGVWVTAYSQGFTAIQSGDSKVVEEVDSGANQVSGVGVLTTSWFDFKTPTTYKLWRAFEVSLSAGTGSGTIAVTANIDNVSALALTAITTSTGNLLFYFPQGTKGLKCQFTLTFTSAGGSGPVVLQYAVRATLARAFTFTVQARRRITCQDGSQDTQGTGTTGSQTGPAQFLVANIENAYKQASGNVTMFIPSPAVTTAGASGVEQISAVIEDYKWTTPKPGPSSSDQGAPDMEGNVEITAVEVLL